MTKTWRQPKETEYPKLGEREKLGIAVDALLTIAEGGHEEGCGLEDGPDECECPLPSEVARRALRKLGVRT